MREPNNTSAQKNVRRQNAYNGAARQGKSPAAAILGGGLHRWPTQRYYVQQAGERRHTALEAIDDKQAVAYALRLYGGAEARVERRPDYAITLRVVVLS